MHAVDNNAEGDLEGMEDMMGSVMEDDTMAASMMTMMSKMMTIYPLRNYYRFL